MYCASATWLVSVIEWPAEKMRRYDAANDFTGIGVTVIVNHVMYVNIINSYPHFSVSIKITKSRIFLFEPRPCLSLGILVLQLDF